MTSAEILREFEEGLLTRSEMVSLLAERPVEPLKDTKLETDVTELRARLASGETFLLGSVC